MSVMAGVAGTGQTDPTNLADQTKPPDPTRLGADGAAGQVPPADRFTLGDLAPNADAYRKAIAQLGSISSVTATPLPAQTAATSTAAAASGIPTSVGPSAIEDRTGELTRVANGKLPRGATIQENGYTFTTDSEGRVASAQGKLTTNPNTGAARNAETKAAQRTVGWDDRLPADHGGHIIADRFNGPGTYANLMAQDGNFNLGEYKKLENGWAKAIDSGQSVSVKVELQYPQGSLRPDQLTVKTRLGSGPIVNNVFHNAPGGKAPATDAESARAPSREPAAARTAESASESAAESTAVVASDASRLSKFAAGAGVAGKIATPLAAAADAYSLYSAYRQDGRRIGSHTLDQAGSVVGGWAGAAVGAETGAEAGAAVGALFGGVGAAPGAVIGGAAGALAGGVVGSGAGKAAVELAGRGIDLGKKAAHSVANFFGF
jgi:hypothetical protein